jgi:hypothetical protein
LPYPKSMCIYMNLHEFTWIIASLALPKKHVNLLEFTWSYMNHR